MRGSCGGRLRTAIAERIHELVSQKMLCGSDDGRMQMSRHSFAIGALSFCMMRSPTIGHLEQVALPVQMRYSLIETMSLWSDRLRD